MTPVYHGGILYVGSDEDYVSYLWPGFPCLSNSKHHAVYTCDLLSHLLPGVLTTYHTFGLVSLYFW